MRALRLTVAVCAVLCSGLPCASVWASVTIGQTGATATCVSADTWVQDSTAAPPVYSVPAGGGVITSWSTDVTTAVAADQTLKLKVLRRDALDPSKFFVVGEDGFRPLTFGGVDSFPNAASPAEVRIPVSGGELLGEAKGPGGAVGCVNTAVPAGDAWRVLSGGDPAVGTSATFGPPSANRRVNISAVVEPDSDGDGFGDETQDRCPGVAGIVNGCPPADLAVSESAGPNPSPVHGRFSYLVQVHNNGPSTVPALATVADTVGPSVTLVAASSPGGACTLGAIVHCSVSALAPGASTTITVTVRADTEGGRANAATVSYGGDTNPANDTAGVTATVVPAPSISAASVSPKAFRLGSLLPKFSRKPPVGTTISFKLSEPARTTLAISQPKTGRRVGRRCVTQTRSNKRKPRCTIPNVRGSMTLNGHAGTNKVRFQGRLSRSKRLKPGRYTVTITATDSAGNRSAGKSVRFTIVR